MSFTTTAPGSIFCGDDFSLLPADEQAENIVELLPPLSSLAAAASLQLPRAATEYCVGATCRRLSGRRVSLVFSKLRVRPWLPLLPWGLPDGVRLEAASTSHMSQF